MSELSRQELLWSAEQLQNAGADLDEPQRRSVERSEHITEERAALLVTGDKNPPDALRRLRDELMEFLLQRPDELTDEELEFRNELMADERLASLLRIYQPGVWYDQFCVYLWKFVFPKWDSSSVKRSRARKRGEEGQRDREGKFKKILDPVTGTKTAIRGKRNRGQRKQPPGHGKKNSDQGKF